MTTPSNVAAGVPIASRDPVPASAPRPMYWSVRRELWENRSIYLAPLSVAGVLLFGSLLSTLRLPHKMRTVLGLDPLHQRQAIAMPYDIAASLILLTAVLTGVFYCLDALHAERRDRSILFWKSLPVSDLTTVLSKASIPLVVLPLVTFVTIVATQLIMLLLSTIVLLVNPLALTTLWNQLPLFQMSLCLLYGLMTLALWHAPIYCWLLLISGWARRATFLWAVLPPIATCILEKIAFNTSHLGRLLGYRLVGWFTLAFNVKGQPGGSANPLAQLTPGHFVSAPGLWVGLIAAAALLAAAVRLRRNREPSL